MSNKSESQSHNTINHSFSICKPCLKTVACTVPEKIVIQMYPESIEKRTNQEKNKSSSPIYIPTVQHLYQVSSFKILASILPERAAIQIFNVDTQNMERKKNK